MIPVALSVESESGYYLVYPRQNDEKPKLGSFRDWLLEQM
jgi:DNA-binding transcriptional LysR family regulator